MVENTRDLAKFRESEIMTFETPGDVLVAITRRIAQRMCSEKGWFPWNHILEIKKLLAQAANAKGFVFESDIIDFIINYFRYIKPEVYIVKEKEKADTILDALLNNFQSIKNSRDIINNMFITYSNNLSIYKKPDTYDSPESIAYNAFHNAIKTFAHTTEKDKHNWSNEQLYYGAIFMSIYNSFESIVTKYIIENNFHNAHYFSNIDEEKRMNLIKFIEEISGGYSGNYEWRLK